MANSTFQVKTYSYYFWSSRDHDIPRMNLNLKGVNGEQCFITFPYDDDPLPEAIKTGNNYWFYYREFQFPMLIDMLRNEKPIYVYFNNDSGFPNSQISTTEEPVGEGEGRITRR